MHDTIDTHRRQLLCWMHDALEAVDSERRVLRALEDRDTDRVAVLALGKAARPMAAGAARVLGNRVAHGLVISPDGLPLSSLSPPWQSLRGDHPVPGENSLRAGKAIETWLRALDPDLPLQVLLSGGGSALAELPVPGMTGDELQRLNRWLLASGLGIHDINAIRARFSQLKRGGMRRLAGDRDVNVLLVSDVPDDAIPDIAAGPFYPQPIEWPSQALPDWLEALHARLPLPSSAEPGVRVAHQIIARNADALDAISSCAEAGNAACVVRDVLSGSASDAGRAIGRRLREGPPGVYLFGGETTVRLPANPGKGGRNQHLALAAALEIAGADNLFLLAFGTDGVDGNTGDAGALVDGGSVDRIHDAGLDAVECLESANSNSALDAAGDVIHTGPTGTNVADVVVGLKTA